MTARGNGSWEQFAPLNTAAEVSGYRSERRVGPLAERILAEELAKPGCPPYLRDPDGPFSAALVSWSRARAVADLLFESLDKQDLAGALAELTREAGEEETSKGTVKRRSVSRRTVSGFDAWLKADKHQAALGAKLGLNPVDGARLSRDLSQSRFYATGPAPIDRRLDQIAAERAALEAGGDD